MVSIVPILSAEKQYKSTRVLSYNILFGHEATYLYKIVRR